jgi:hypothetical protein
MVRPVAASSSLKAVELANLTSPSLAKVINQAPRASSGSEGRRTWPTRSYAMPGQPCRSSLAG